MAAVSAIVALAFALFPVLAQAGDSAGAQYQDRLPTATGPGGNGPGNGGDDGGDDGSSGGQGSRQLRVRQRRRRGGRRRWRGLIPAVGSLGLARVAGRGTARPRQTRAREGRRAVAHGTGSVKFGQSAADFQTSNGDDGGSSPLAGILVGLGLGAIVSIIFVVLRARRQRGQSEPVHSPHAG